MAVGEFRYPSEWTESYDKYLQYKDHIMDDIRELIDNYDDLQFSLNAQVKKLETEFFSGEALYKHVRESI
jgi:hypothetical protein